MNTAQRETFNLNRSIRAKGSPVRLMRFAGTTTPTFTADITAWVHPYGSSELTDTIKQGDYLLVISPSDLDAAGWPGAGQGAPTDPHAADPRILKPNVDKCMFEGIARNVIAVLPKRVGSVLVRIDCQVRG